MWRYDYNELYHYGIKGMRWGVRRSKEELAKQRNAEVEKNDAIRSGIVSTNVNKHQFKHLRGAIGYIKGRSYLLANDVNDAQRLINELSGTGYAVTSKKGEWQRKERVKTSKIIGVCVDEETGKEIRTKIAMIAYSKNGAHIYPVKGE